MVDIGRHVIWNTCERRNIFLRDLQEIIEVEFPRLLKLKCVIFKCDWFDPVVNRGIRFNKFSVVDVNDGRMYNKVEPFIFA